MQRMTLINEIEVHRRNKKQRKQLDDDWERYAALRHQLEAINEWLNPKEVDEELVEFYEGRLQVYGDGLGCLTK